MPRSWSSGESLTEATGLCNSFNQFVKFVKFVAKTSLQSLISNLHPPILRHAHHLAVFDAGVVFWGKH